MSLGVTFLICCIRAEGVVPLGLPGCLEIFCDLPPREV